MRTHPLIVSLAVVAAALPQASRAQGLGPRDSLVWAALARLQPGKGVRLHTAGLGRLEGRFASVTDSTVTVGMAPAATSVALAGIDSLWQRGSAAGTGALVGAVTGGLFLGVAVAAYCEADVYGCTEEGGMIAVGALIGAAGGALVGGVIGALVPTWKRRVP